jgi:acetyl esterase/lipase
VPHAALPGVVLYVHGGGFVSCSAATHRPIAAALARLTARRVFSVDYRLAPEHRFPAAVEDVFAAYEWLLAAAAPDQGISLAGDSAGGNLVLGLSIRLRDQGRPAPACVVAFSPWTDLAGTGASARRNDGHDVMFHYENLAEFATVYLDGARADAPEASPVYANLAGLSPMLLHVGSTEILLDDARRIDDAVRVAGGACQLKVYDDVAHCWQMLVPLVPEATASLRDAASFISSHLRPATLSAA